MDANRMKRELGGGAVFPIGAENTAYAQYFTGECYLNMLTTSGVGIGVVTFAPGTINAWHIHHKGGQILLVTGGRGWYQEDGKPARALAAGDVVNIPPEVKHWHGAAAGSIQPQGSLCCPGKAIRVGARLFIRAYLPDRSCPLIRPSSGSF